MMLCFVSFVTFLALLYTNQEHMYIYICIYVYMCIHKTSVKTELIYSWLYKAHFVNLDLR